MSAKTPELTNKGEIKTLCPNEETDWPPKLKSQWRSRLASSVGLARARTVQTNFDQISLCITPEPQLPQGKRKIKRKILYRFVMGKSNLSFDHHHLRKKIIFNCQLSAILKKRMKFVNKKTLVLACYNGSLFTWIDHSKGQPGSCLHQTYA